MIAVYILLALSAAFALFYLIPTLIVASRIFTVLFVRTNKEKWSRTCSWDDMEQREMFRAGEEWGEKYKSVSKTLTVKSGKFNLVGEYFDFGGDKAVIIIPGRMETCLYSYYFAEGYRESGYNVLAIDNRSHGLSDGRYNTIGFNEYKDILKWGEKLFEDEGVKKIVLHGICIGAATALYALTSDKCPDYFVGMVADGMYADFKESLINHIVERKHNPHPVAEEVMWMVKTVAGRTDVKKGPYNYIGKLDKPVCFIYGLMDTYSTPDKAKELFAACGSSKKRIVWFEKGVHSHLKINAPEKYDKTVKDFLKEEIND